MMISNKISSAAAAAAGSGCSFSVQSCFPEIRSITDDLSVTIGCSDDEMSLKDAFPHPISYQSNYTVSSFSYNFRRQQSCPHLLPSHATSASLDFPARLPNHTDVVLDGSLWPNYSPSEDVAQIGWNFFTPYVSLHFAALKGDWNMAREFLDLNPQALCARLTMNSEIALHIAAGAGHTKFVQELVKLMAPDDLALKNNVGNTALCFAAVSGIKEIAEAMVNKNENLPSIRGSKGATPLCMAALLGHKDMVWYLYNVTHEDDLTENDRIELLVATINSDLYDVALFVSHQYPELALARDGNGETALHVLARRPLAFPSGIQLGIWQRFIYSRLHVESHSISVGHDNLSSLISKVPGIKAIFETKLRHIWAIKLVKQLWEQVLSLDDSSIGEFLRKPSRLLFNAAELGNVDFIIILIRMYPGLIWKVDDQSRSIFHIAVLHRQERIFRLIYEIGAHKDLIAAYKDENTNNMLHLAGKLAPPDRLKTDSGAALQLRREVQWFKEVEKIVQPSYRDMKNSEGRTPYILFVDEHKRLVSEGEKWMKDTASSCMVVSTLIATVMFAAAFTVPGGNNNNTGRPILLHYMSFILFSVSNAFALFSAATSILMFLSILTSRYAEEDFLDSLPQRLVMGLATLFISIASMMVAFNATLFIVLGHDFAWLAIPIATVACVPVALFVRLQFPLFADMITHLYSSSICFRPSNHLLY